MAGATGRRSARSSTTPGVMFDRLGDRVATWLTHNEPWCQAFLGHATGHHAPGRCDWSAAYQVAHHLLLSHGLAVQRFRASGATGGSASRSTRSGTSPASDDEADLAARDRVWANAVDLFLDPIVHGRYPEALMDWIGRHAPGSGAGDLETIRQPIDFLGVNYYNAETISLRRRRVAAEGPLRAVLGAGLGPDRRWAGGSRRPG